MDLLSLGSRSPQRDMTRMQCNTCLNTVGRCTCLSCSVCTRSYRQRNHCARCMKAVCASCCSRARYTSLGITTSPVHVCDRCAMRESLSRLLMYDHALCDTPQSGLLLLLEVCDAGKCCVQRELCPSLSYSATCPECLLPTIPLTPYDDRVVDVPYEENEPWWKMKKLSRSIIGISNDTHVLLRTPPPTLYTANLVPDPKVNRILTLSLICAGMCYEYPRYPEICLLHHALPASTKLRVISTSQRYSVFESPGRIRYVAFPGTHDARTGLTDMQISRVHVRMARPCVGDTPGVCHSISLRPRYKVHSGFLAEANRVVIPEVLDWVRDGFTIVYCGHSLGGAIAALATVHLLSCHFDELYGKLYCVTAGTPMIGNHRLRDYVKSMNASCYFHHFVYRGDLFPRIAMGHNTPRQLIRDTLNAIDSARETIVGAAEEARRKVSTWFWSDLEKPKRVTYSLISDTVLNDSNDVSPAGSTRSSPARCRRVSSATPQELLIPEMAPLMRSFEFFGTFHLLSISGIPYHTTSDSEEVFQSLSQKVSEITPLDHFMDAYMRAIIRHCMMGCSCPL